MNGAHSTRLDLLACVSSEVLFTRVWFLNSWVEGMEAGARRKRRECRGSNAIGKRQIARSRNRTVLLASKAWQQPRTNTRRSARITREVYSAWCRRLGPVDTVARLPAEQVQVVFNDMQLFPTKAQVCDMLQCAKDCSDRNTASYLTFGEFCTFATELKRCYEKGISCSSSLTKLLDKDGKQKKKQQQPQNKISKMIPNYEVFLGGSCNPTTWRQEVAIPLLKNLGITYYNPQVDKWSSDLVELEYHVKENASILFYVISSDTRNVAGIIEAAHMAGARRKLILVIDRYKPEQKLSGEPISQQEYEELTTSLKVLQELVEGQGIPVFHDIPLAINCTAKVLRDGLNGETHGITDYKSAPNKVINHQNGDSLVKLKEAFNAVNKKRNGQIYLSDVYMACRILMDRKISVPEMKRITSHSDCIGARNSINFEEFCSIVSDLKGNSMSSGVSTSTTTGTNGLTNGIVEKRIQNSQVAPSVATAKLFDVYIGSCSVDNSWVEDIVIPILKKHNLSYYQGTKYDIQRLGLSKDGNAINNCYMMLFYIPSDVRGLATMAMASHYIGLGCNMILCIQHLVESITSLSDKDDKVNEESISDYNRGRIYLRDLAERDDIPVFSDMEQAVQCLIQKCTQTTER